MQNKVKMFYDLLIKLGAGFKGQGAGWFEF